MTSIDESTIHYRLAEHRDEAEIADFLVAHFIPSEPISRSVGVTSVDARESMQAMAKESLSEPCLSFLALNDKNEIVGLRLSKGLYPRDYKEIQLKAPCSNNSPPINKVLNFLDIIDYGYPSLIPQTCHKIVKFIIISVNPAYQRRGIATILTKLTLDQAKKLHFQGAMITATAKNSQALFAKMGFDVLKIVHHKYYLDENGARIFNTDDGTDKGQLMFKMLD